MSTITIDFPGSKSIEVERPIGAISIQQFILNTLKIFVREVKVNGNPRDIRSATRMVGEGDRTFEVLK